MYFFIFFVNHLLACVLNVDALRERMCLQNWSNDQFFYIIYNDNWSVLI